MDEGMMELGLEIIRSYERWGTWLVSLSVTALGALSVRHGLRTRHAISRAAFCQFLTVVWFLAIACAFSIFFGGNIKYVGIQLVAGKFGCIEEIQTASLNPWAPPITVWLASAISGIAFGIGVFAFAASES